MNLTIKPSVFYLFNVAFIFKYFKHYCFGVSGCTQSFVAVRKATHIYNHVTLFTRSLYNRSRTLIFFLINCNKVKHYDINFFRNIISRILVNELSDFQTFCLQIFNGL